MSDLLIVERHSAVALLVLNRPAKRNALSSELLEALTAELERIAADEAVGAVVLAGNGPVWCAGVDLHELVAGPRPPRADEAVVLLRTLPQPTVAAIHGACVTGGLELALACDMRIASVDARFADTHARVGAHPGWGMSVMLPRVVGRSMAFDMSLTGDYIDAQTAHAAGLVSRVLPADGFRDAAVAIAASITSGSRATLRAIAGLYAADPTMEAAFAAERAAHRRFREGMDYADVDRRRRDVIAHGRAVAADQSAGGEPAP
jgi:enoyl-CoA hydratase